MELVFQIIGTRRTHVDNSSITEMFLSFVKILE